MTIVKGSVSLMKLLIWEVSNGCSYLLDPLRKDMQDKKNWFHWYIYAWDDVIIVIE